MHQHAKDPGREDGEGGFATRFRYPAARGLFYRRRKSFASFSAPRRTRTYNPMIKSQRPDPDKPTSANGLRLSPKTIGAHLAHDTRKTDPDFAVVMNAWPDLPEAIKAAIMALVKASR
jgi:hypothetical protein